MGWKPGALDRLERALGLRVGDAGGDGLGQVAPAVDLLHGSDEDALADGQQVELGKEEFGGAAQAAFRVGEQTQDAVVVNLGHAGALGPSAEDEGGLDRLGRERKSEREGPAGAGNLEALPVDTRSDG